MDKKTKESLVKGFTGIGTGVVCDAMVLLGYPIRVITGLQKLAENQPPFAGFAVTLKQMERYPTETDYNLTKHGAVIDGLLTEGDVLVIDNNGRTDICNGGGLLARRAKKVGCVGYIVNGCIRDVDEIAEMNFPVYFKNSNPIKSQPQLQTVAINEPVVIDKVQIHPGDMIVADRTGIVAFPEEWAEKILEKAQELREYEAKVIKAIDEGKHIFYDTDYMKEAEYPVN